MRKSNQWKHVFCLEGLWDDNLKSKSSIEPALELLSKHYPLKYIHKNCATTTELEFYLSKWIQQRYKDYPILYLAFHGSEQTIDLSDGSYTMDEVAEILSGKCSNRIIIFGSCGTLGIDKRHITRFLKNTGALAVCGYKTDIDWVMSSVHDILIIESLQDNEYSLRGIDSISAKLRDIAKRFKDLEFRVVTKKDICSA